MISVRAFDVLSQPRELCAQQLSRIEIRFHTLLCGTRVLVCANHYNVLASVCAIDACVRDALTTASNLPPRAVAHQVYDEDGVAADDDDDDLSHMRLDLIICFPFVSVQWTGCRAPL